jgi:rhodanese-related sulfurtransferase
MKTRRLFRPGIESAIVASVLGGCAIAPQSDSVRDQHGHAQLAPIVNFHVVDAVESQAMYRGAQPNDESQWAFLHDLGVTTVLKLNEYVGAQSTAEEERLAAKKYGIRVVPVFVPPEDFPHNLNPFAAPSDTELKAALEVMEDPRNRPLYIHCSHGRDRTGLLVALYRIRQNNYCKDKAFAEMKTLGHNLLLPGLRHTLYDDTIVENPACIK